MLLVSVLVRVLEVQLLLSSVGPQDLTLGVIRPWGLRRVTPGAKVQVVLQPLCHGSANERAGRLLRMMSDDKRDCFKKSIGLISFCYSPF